MGLPGSIVHSIHCISRNENAVIILDQLDALRWTQANSSEALAVCMELIRQVEYLNCERKKKIIIIFVCRIYDLENDNNINSLFKKKETAEDDWEIVKVEDFSEDVVTKIVGKHYEQLSSRLKKLLRIPSNLYIWQHLDREEVYADCLTTSHLIDKWFEQICRKSVTAGLQQKSVCETKENIVDALDKTGRLYVPKQILHVEEASLDYLVSSEVAKDIILTYKSIDMDVEFPLSKMFYDKYIDVKNDREFLREFMKTKVSRRTVRAFVRYLEENAVSIVDYADIIIQLCENILQMEIETLREQWGIEDEISKLIISLYDETANSSRMTDKQIAGKCLDLWDIMFERQLVSVREVSRKLMER